VELRFSEIEEMIGEPLSAEAFMDTWGPVGNEPRSPLGVVLDQAGFGVAMIAGTPSTSGYVGPGRGLHRWPGYG